jgi:hypothetical protein
MAKRKVTASKETMEIIAVRVDGEICRTYHGYLGTFAGFSYCCIDKKVLPGFFQKTLVKKATLGDRKLELVLSGKRTQEELVNILNEAILNMVAFPHEGSEAQFFIEAKSNKKGR